MIAWLKNTKYETKPAHVIKFSIIFIIIITSTSLKALINQSDSYHTLLAVHKTALF
jgi:hypothetical protein